MSNTDNLLVLITGPMFAGKSTELCERYEKVRILSEQRAIIIAPQMSKDATASAICPRERGRHPATFVETLTADFARRLVDDRYEHVFIDEAQFFSQGEELMIFCKTLNAYGVRVCVAALNLDYRKRYWPAIAVLQQLKPDVEVLSARCTLPCKERADYTAKITPSGGQSETATIDILAEYKPLCRSCYLKNQSSKKPAKPFVVQ